MNEAKKRYAKKCKTKIITFYKQDADLLAFANSVNFQAYVKQCIRASILKRKMFEGGKQ